MKKKLFVLMFITLCFVLGCKNNEENESMMQQMSAVVVSINDKSIIVKDLNNNFKYKIAKENIDEKSVSCLGIGSEVNVIHNNISTYNSPSTFGKVYSVDVLSCSDKGNILEIVDKSVLIDDFVCDQALEKFYEDDKFIYYYSCIKDDYVVVKYENQKEEKVSNALQEKIIDISDLDKYSIKYYKETIKDFDITINLGNENEAKEVYKFKNKGYSVYYYGVDSAYVKISNNSYELIDAISKGIITLDEIITNMDLVNIYKDGGTKLYKTRNNIYSDNNHYYSVLVCNTVNGNKDIYIGNKEMVYENNFCR